MLLAAAFASALCEINLGLLFVTVYYREQIVASKCVLPNAENK